MKEQIELVVNEHATLGEGPCWDPITGNLYWIDSFGCRIFIFNPASGKNRVISVDKYIGCVAPVDDRRIIVALQDGFYSLDLKTEKLILLRNPERNIVNNRFNDGKIDCLGRFWCGSMSMEEKGGECDFEPTGALYRMEEDLGIIKVLDNVTLSNGLTWSRDNRTFYYIDTPTMGVDAFNFEISSGNLSDRRRVIHFSDNEGIPDGMTIDREGKLWVCHYGGGRLSRWDPISGKKLDEIVLPCVHVTSCTFGGDDYNDLYITTATVGMTKEQMNLFPEAGGLFRIRPDVGGFPGNRFAGLRVSEDQGGKTIWPSLNS